MIIWVGTTRSGIGDGALQSRDAGVDCLPTAGAFASQPSLSGLDGHRDGRVGGYHGNAVSAGTVLLTIP